MWTGYQIFPSFKANGNLDFYVKMANLKMFIEVPFFSSFLFFLKCANPKHASKGPV